MKKEFPGNKKQYGKGSKRRPEDPRKVAKNWEGIKGFRKAKFD